MPPILPQALPPELLGIIMAYIDQASWSDKSTLAACALVSRGWVVEARRYLCASIRVDSDVDFQHLIEQVVEVPSYMPLLVRRFNIYEFIRADAAPWAQHVWQHVAQRFPNVQNVYVKTNGRMHPRIQDYRAGSALTSVQILDIFYWDYSQFNTFRQFLGLFPTLKDLRCHGVTWTVPQDIGTHSTPYISSSLVNISVMECTALDNFLYLWLPPDDTVQSLSIPVLPLGLAVCLRELVQETIAKLPIKCPIVFTRSVLGSNCWCFRLFPGVDTHFK